MALGLSIDMDLRFFKGNGVVVTWAPLDIRLICFARPFAHNTFREIWNSSTSNQAVTSLRLEESRTCSFSKPSILWYPLFTKNFCIPKSFSKSLKSLVNFSTRSLNFSTIVRLVQALKFWNCVSTSKTSH